MSIKKTGKFRPFVERVMPAVYDDSLTYYEMLSKVVAYLNQMNDQANEVIDFMDNAINIQDKSIVDVQTEFIKTRDFLNDAYELFKIEIENDVMPVSVETVLDGWFDNGKLAGIINDEVFDMKVGTDRFESEMSKTMQKEEYDGRFLKLARYTKGFGDNGAVAAIVANNPDPKAQVIAWKETKDASSYGLRDSVALYVSNRSTKPTLTVSTGSIIYTSKAVQFDLDVDLNAVEVGMMIDTLHTPERFTSIIESVNPNTKTITVKDGWYRVKSGGSETPEIPPNNIGFDVNLISKIWGINNNAFLYEEDKTNSGVAEEIGLFNYKEGGTLGGIDLVNFSKRSAYGFQVRKAGSTPNGFSQGFVSRDALTSFASYQLEATDHVLISHLNGDGFDKGFNIKSNGTLSKLKLRPQIFTAETTYNNIETRVFVLNRSTNLGFELPSPSGRSGEFIHVLNVGTGNSSLSCRETGNFVREALASPTITMQGKSYATMVSDGNSWYLIGHNLGTDFKGDVTVSGKLEAEGRRVQTIREGNVSPIATATPQFIGQTYVDTVSKIGYLAVGLLATDWKQITS